MYQYILFHKPYHVLSQFSAEGDKKTLAHFFSGLNKNIYPVGRLDYDSEGLLLLTDDKTVTHKLLDPESGHTRTYLVQVDGDITDPALRKLSAGVDINIDGRPWHTKKAVVEKLKEPPEIDERNPPVRFRKSIPTSWITLALTEGKNRQVRRMTASVGFPTLRLIRYAIGGLKLDGIKPGRFKILDNAEKELLFRKKVLKEKQ